jgi:GT2 family glycosyltransferase
MKDKPRICIGIPCYQNAPAETLEDYMRFAFHCGRRMQNYDFFLGIKPKFEQFRARNAICEVAMQMDCDYLLMLDDDHVIEWQQTNYPGGNYDFLRKLLKHMENDPKIGIVGAMYFHRGGDCQPVLMKRGTDGGFYYMRDDEIIGGLQDVAVTGGGCMLINMTALSSIPSPIFAPEFKYGTDIQVCKKVAEAGYRVCCDTGIIIGHVKTTREVVTPENRIRIMAESQAADRNENQFDPRWTHGTAYNLFYLDGMEYLGLQNHAEMVELAMEYNEKIDRDFPGSSADEDTLVAYYRSRGVHQVARQLFFHGTEIGHGNDNTILSLFKAGDRMYGLDYCCGTSLVGFELALRGHQVDFVDIDGAPGYEFLKWRAKKRDIEHRCGWEIKGPYQFILLLDALEHLVDPVSKLKELAGHLVNDGVIVTNYFYLDDHYNAEHISMDRDAAKQALLDCGIFPLNSVVWIKRDLGFMDRPVEKSAA